MNLTVITLMIGIVVGIVVPRPRLRRFGLLALCLLSILLCCACSGFTALWTVGNVALGAVETAVAALGTAIGTSVAASINSWVSKIQTLWNDLKTDVTAYTGNESSGTLAAVQAVIASIQQELPGIDAIVSATPIVSTVINAVVAAVGAVLSYLAANVIPAATEAKAQFLAGNNAKAKALDEGMKAQSIKIRGDFEAAIAASGLDAGTVKKINDHMEHETHAHIGPARI